ncbi:zinc finger MYM-type protein 1-like [Hemicordylus capensis]|uniref:zinc finger MYM-type protein 1-like n=1 Tax=Hemicordylus capensis TaxID=884348 RepID=UPI002304BF1B|nr:zinc finger MYM-type protein 1-like [Hemicordylus capensis]
MAFHGTTEKLYSENNGNFLKLVEFLALFDPVMTEHVRRVKDEETMVHYLGKEIQNELIELLATSIKQNILARINSAKYYSVILDCTPDVSHTEQMTMIVRFVDVIMPSDTETSEPEVTIKEHFLGFVPLKKTTCAFMAETLLWLLEQMGLPLENLRGQGYDNGSNMRGKEHGVQKRVLDINPRAFFVPCSAHSLNLVVNDAAKSCREATGFFMLAQQIYNYLSASTQHWQILTSHVPTITVKPLSQTRWESRIDALKPLRYHLGSIYDALMEIYNEPHPHKTTSESLVVAKGLAEDISKFKFVVSLVVWYNMLFEINLTSKLLQNKETDLSSATSQLQVTKNYLVGCRCDDGFEQVLIDASVTAKELEILPNFETEQFRQRRKKKQFGYEAPDEAPQDAKQKFKVDFYYAILDMAIQSVEERFQQLQHYNSVFGFLYDIYSINKKCTEDVRKACKTLEQSLTHNENKDIDAEDLCCELQAVARRLPESMRPQKTKKMRANFPDLPVTQAALDIRRKLQKQEGFAGMNTTKLLAVANRAKSSWVPVVEGHYEAEVSMGIHVSGARDPTGQVQFLMKGDWEKPTEHLVHAMFWKEMGTVMEVPAVTKNLFVDLAERVALSLSVTNCYVCADTKINDQGKAIEEITDRMRKLAHVPA